MVKAVANKKECKLFYVISYYMGSNEMLDDFM